MKQATLDYQSRTQTALCLQPAKPKPQPKAATFECSNYRVDHAFADVYLTSGFRLPMLPSSLHTIT